MTNELKFYWNGIKHNGFLYTGSWSKSCDGKTVRLYLSCKSGYRFNPYSWIPDFNYDGARQKNDSDAMTDYFETTTIIFSGVLYDKALDAYNKAQARFEARQKRRYARQ